MMKTMVLVPELQPGMPWASRPISFPYECIQVAHAAWFAMRWQYSKSSLLPPSAEFAISQNQVIGILHTVICWGVGTVGVNPVHLGVAAKFKMPKSDDTTYWGLYMSRHDSIASCIILLEADLVVRLVGGGCLSSSWEMQLCRVAGDYMSNRGELDWEHVDEACMAGRGPDGFAAICSAPQSSSGPLSTHGIT